LKDRYQKARETAESIAGCWHFLVLAEDWCEDAVHVSPFLARLEEASPHFDLRIL
jgi:hypothetical protein